MCAIVLGGMTVSVTDHFDYKNMEVQQLECQYCENALYYETCFLLPMCLYDCRPGLHNIRPAGHMRPVRTQLQKMLQKPDFG